MSYVTPATAITVYKNVPMDNGYSQTVYYPSEANQESYFNGLVSKTYNNYTYQRKERDKIKVEALADDLYECNYLSFKNRSGKTFYCFITGCEYVSEACTELTFEIDVMQTYMFDYQYLPCWVERQHANSDTIGSNLVPEPIALGDYKYQKQTRIKGSKYSDMNVLGCCVAICDTDETVEVNIYDGIAQGTNLYGLTGNNMKSGLTNLLNKYTSKPEAVVVVYMCPEDMITLCGGGTSGSPMSGGAGDALSELVTLDNISAGDALGTYTPKNNKCYTYPFCFMMIDDHAGSSLSLRYEFWRGSPQVALRGTISYPPKIVLNPEAYGNGGASVIDFTQSLSLENYPQCSWACDSFNNWCGTTGIPMVLSATTNAAVGAVVGGPFGAISAASQITSIATDMYQASIAADMCRGNADIGNVNCASTNQYFTYATAYQNEDQMRVIDDFFTRYGYAQNRIMTPNPQARSKWTYIKTDGCTIGARQSSGSAGLPPGDDMKKICSILDNGITFWQMTADIGDYSQENELY